MKKYFLGVFKMGMIVLLSSFLFSCAPKSPTMTLSWAEGKQPRIAVMPFQKASPEDIASHLLVYNSEMVSQDEANTAENVVITSFMDKLSQNEKIDVIPVADTHKLYRRVTSEAVSEAGTPGTDKERILRIGRELNADAIVVGYIYRFRERDGTPYAVQKPASVAYEIRLLDGKTGASIWQGAFDKTQRSLMENLFHLPTFIRGKGQWMTAKELTDEGMEDLFQSFPVIR
jgi:nucleotide-binding universal stress UspA family protein